MGNRLNNATAADLEAAAQSHANATWGWGVTAAVVWYFWGWGWALIPGVFVCLGVVKSASATMSAYRVEKSGAATYGAYKAQGTPDPLMYAQSLVNQYGEILEAAGASIVADVALLPASKDTMKAAILLCIKASKDPNMKEQLRAGYVALSIFQEGVDVAPTHALHAASLHEGEVLLNEVSGLAV